MEVDKSDVCMRARCHTCSGKKKYHVYSNEDIEEIKQSAINDFKYYVTGEIEQLRAEVIKETGSYKYDGCYTDCINIIKNHEKDNWI